MTGAKKQPGSKPVRFSKRVWDELMFNLTSMSLTAACSLEGMPSISTVYDWLDKSDIAVAAKDEADPYFTLAASYARAIETRVARMADETLDIADTPQIGEVVDVEYQTVRAWLTDEQGNLKLDENGHEIPDPEHPSGWKMVETGRKVKRVDMIERARLRVDTRKWFLARMQSQGRGTGRVSFQQSSATGVVNVNQNGEVQPGATGFVINLINSPDDPAK